MAESKGTQKDAALVAGAASAKGDAKPAEKSAAASAPHEAFPELAPLLNVPIRLSIELGRRPARVRDLTALCPGMVFELDKLTGERVDIVSGNYAFARGEIVVSGDTLIARISEILKVGEELE